ncbi:hypothetical protein [Nocardia jiangxiensis]|uniref:DUF4286 family protein n=1 Tax=Nocardia jiangxiensis TaxID=282685 RepID=A0ABW6S435_9NOCA|nr:hypothetical protein [Nocardia jiangxiensis]
MAKGILYVESEPNSPEEAAAYHDWYENTHLTEMLGVDGFIAARRFEPIADDGPFVAIYEIEAEDIAAVQARLGEATRAGAFSAPVGLRTDRPPTTRFLRQIHTRTA